MDEGNQWFSHIKKHGRYRSGFEKMIADQLDAAGVRFTHETSKLPYRFGEEDTRYYIPDFVVHTKAGEKVFIEAKGWMDPASVRKMKAVRWQNPKADIRMVFQSENTKVARLKSNGLKWAKRVGFPAAARILPPEWLAEFRTVEEFRQMKH